MPRGAHRAGTYAHCRCESCGSLRAPRGSRRGAATVEFAMVAPVIFLFFFASIETGRLLMAIHGLDAAAREGCRQAISWGVTSEKVEQSVAARLTNLGISGHSMTIEPDPPANAQQWDPVTIQIVVPYGKVTWLPLPRFLQEATLRGSCTLPKESKET